MQWIRNLKIKYKILGIAFVGVVGFSIYLTINFQVAQLNSERLSSIRNIYFPILERADKNIVHLDRIKEIWTTAVTTGDEDLAEDAQNVADSVTKIYQEIIDIDPSENMKVEIKNLILLFDLYFNSAKKLSLGVIDESLSKTQLQDLSSKLERHLEEYNGAIKTFRQVEYEQFNLILEQADHSSQNNLMWGLIISISAMLILIGTAIVISHSIGDGINKIKHAMEKLSEGNLTTHITYSSKDEIGQLIQYHNDSLANLRHLIEVVIQSTIQLITKSDSLLSAMSNTNDSVNKQKQESEQLATAITEMAASITEVAQNTSEAVVATTLANTRATEGLDVVTSTGQSIQQLTEDVESAATTINLLEQDSENIGNVLDVIKGIAEQTNLLALNAAIEAARAGEQGRGFAVVADEVRTLASRTQESTLEIQRTIEKLQAGAQKAVEAMGKGRAQARDSLEQSNAAGDLLNNVTHAMLTVTEVNAHIASATEEQSAVAEEINKNIVSINALADKTSTYAAKTNDTVLEVELLSERLTELVSQFKVS